VRGAGAGKVRVKTAKNRTAQSTRWLQRQLNDPYVKQAKAQGWRSRAAFKLMELDEKFGLLKGARAVVDLGVAPGGWAQVVRKRVPQAKVVGIDLLPVDPIEGVVLLQMDFLSEAADAALNDALGDAPDLVLSDMAANTVGHRGDLHRLFHADQHRADDAVCLPVRAAAWPRDWPIAAPA
jgi:23S rRNA (uridine2552-2'-O)-methyltransferase